MKTKKSQNDEPSLREKLSEEVLRAFEADFSANGVAVIEQLRLKFPERYAELAGKLIAAAQPQSAQNKYANCQSTDDVARTLLVECGANEFAIDEKMIEEAIAEQDRHVEELGRIAARAVQ
jgi:hypothetical protein